MPKFIASIDQGTTSSRCLYFDAENHEIKGDFQVEHKQITPHPGWLEHDPMEIFNNTVECMNKGFESLKAKVPGVSASDVVAVGITNQRETTVAWSRKTGAPLCNAIVWSDVRTASVVDAFVNEHGKGDTGFLREKCGLPCSTYFSAMKMRWMIQNSPKVQDAVTHDDLMFGTIDSWLIYCLTSGKVHATDCTNACRTMLMNLKTLQWDPEVCGLFGISKYWLPEIRSNCGDFGKVTCNKINPELKGIRIAGAIGDQQGSLFGHRCFMQGQAKNTYGTGCFLLANIGKKIKYSDKGLLTTVAFKAGDNADCIYALEGAIGGAGSTIQWMRDRLEFYSKAPQTDAIASKVDSTGGVVFVPAFGGLLAPYWRPDARAAIMGMTQQTTKAHIIRAAFEGISMQVEAVVKAVEHDTNITFNSFRVDGGLANSKTLMQIQADLLDIPLMVPKQLECTALGAALCAGIGVGLYTIDSLTPDPRSRKVDSVKRVFKTKINEEERAQRKKLWEQAVERTFAWPKL